MAESKSADLTTCRHPYMGNDETNYILDNNPLGNNS